MYKPRVIMVRIRYFNHQMYRLHWTQTRSFSPDENNMWIADTHCLFLFFKGGYGGRIINIASVAGIMPMAKTIEHSSYTVAKHGVVALTRSFVPAAFPKRSVHVCISKFYPDFIKHN